MRSKRKATLVASAARHAQAENVKDHFLVPTVRILDPIVAEAFIRDRQERGVDQDDEVWEGEYIVPPLANNPHQDLGIALATILFLVVNLENRGRAQAGANVSDRRVNWEKHYRCPDLVVVLHGGRAVDCGTHWCGGPDFLIEIRSPDDDTDAKIPFYEQLGVRELLVIDRDTRELTLYRHDGQRLVAIDHKGNAWLDSTVVPLSFRRKLVKKQPRTEVRRNDGQAGQWTV